MSEEPQDNSRNYFASAIIGTWVATDDPSNILIFDGTFDKSQSIKENYLNQKILKLT